VDSGGAHSASGLGYDDRGWTTFERMAAMLAKRTSDWAWPLLLTSAADADTRTLRGPPLTPEAFGALLELKTFTNGKSDRALVASLYAQTASAVIKDAVILKYGGLGWADEECEALCAYLPVCERLQELSLIGNRISDRGALALAAVAAAGGLRSLQVLDLSNNAIGAAGLEKLRAVIDAGGLPSLTNLKHRSQKSDLGELLNGVGLAVHPRLVRRRQDAAEAKAKAADMAAEQAVQLKAVAWSVDEVPPMS